MRYRDAKKLHNGDQIVRKSDNQILIVQDIEVYGQYKKVRLNCVTFDNVTISLFHEEVE